MDRAKEAVTLEEVVGVYVPENTCVDLIPYECDGQEELEFINL